MIQSFEDIDEAVAEYLERRRFANTLECFRSEIRHRTLLRDRLGKSDETLEGSEGGRRRRSGCGDEGRDRGHQTTSTGSVALFKAFDDGDLSAFLSAWAAFIPNILRRGTPSSLARELRVAEFLACVHCAVLPFRATALAKAAGPREASVACAKSMSSFRRYLDRAQDVPRVPDLSGYYALPHVPDPSVHPSFEALFEDTWSVSKGK
ncbi:similar to F59G1.4 [Ectocarpus siliculosus]|uniref:Similar to F59G1.4 n=1 Tax=Ectocarpus siliculosus TaxID=2880 RepID=D7G1W2_ECTSI|nr:similar to F59G1.4 [Ectocarpus siliculosus]|eukprot:CBJ48688.1 similar to F59G1.4 [Ectocarpus siliculosus]